MISWNSLQPMDVKSRAESLFLMLDGCVLRNRFKYPFSEWELRTNLSVQDFAGPRQTAIIVCIEIRGDPRWAKADPLDKSVGSGARREIGAGHGEVSKPA